MTTAARMTRFQTAYKSIRIEHPRLRDAHVRLTEARDLGRATRGTPQKIMPIIGPSGSGKSTIFDTWADAVSRDAPGPGSSRPVLRVTLSAKATVKQLGIDILHGLGHHGLPFEVIDDLGARRTIGRARRSDPLARAVQPQIMHATLTALTNARVELLAIDEIHHLVDSDGKTRTAWSVSETLKVMTDIGVCPIVVIGTYAAHRIIYADNNPQFAGRCSCPIVLDPLDHSLKDEVSLFAGYVAAIGENLRAPGMFDVKQDLLRDDFLECFYDVSGGVIGTVSRLVEHAAMFAIRRGSEVVDKADLSMATRSWAMALRITDHDPWRNGARDLKVARKRVL